MKKPVLWTSEEAATATNGRAEGHWQVTGISIDTRSLQPGDLFVALKDARDGHDFVPNAYEAGAAACMVSREISDVPALWVEDTLMSLEQLGEAARARTDAFCCAITGSVGKTSVKEMLAQIFRSAGPAHWNVKSFNNHFGVPITLARMPRETTRAVFEIGMNTPGEIAPRSRMVRPHAALITKIAPAHLEGMGTEEAVADEKASIFAGLMEGGVAILPATDRFFDYLKDKALGYAPTSKILTFGGKDSDAYVTGSQSDGIASTFQLNVRGEIAAVTIDAVGSHWGDNVAAAMLMAVVSGLSASDAAEALSGYAPPSGRGNAERLLLSDGGDFLLVDDAYNANPESMRAALGSFAQRPASRRIIALGEMKELGENADALHRSLAAHILASKPAKVYLVGEGIRPLIDRLVGKTQIEWAVNAAEVQKSLNKVLTNGDAVLIKGSNASGVRSLADGLRKWSKGQDSLVPNGRVS